MALHTRAHAYLKSGQPEKVLADADQILAISPGDESAVGLRGGALVDLDRAEEAEKTFVDLHEEAKGKDDQDGAARKCAALATFYRSQKDVARAEETFGKCLQKYPSHPLLQQWVSQFFIDIKKPEKAADVWRAAVKATPEDLGLRARLADTLSSQGRNAEALEVLNEAVELFDTPQAWRMLASFQQKSGNASDARKALESAMERTRNVSAPMRFALGDMLVAEGDLARAEEIAAGLDEPSYQLLLRGSILLADDKPKQALAQFDKGLRLWPNNAGARFLAGRAAQQLGDRKRALDEYREAVRVGETETDAALRLAEIHYSLGQFKAALQFADRHIKKRPYVEPTAHVIAARSAAGLKQMERAESFLQNLKAEDKTSPTPYIEFAALKRMDGGAAAAVEILTRSELDLTDPANSEALRALASDYLTLGKTADANELVGAAVAAHPDSKPLLDLQARVMLRQARQAETQKIVDRLLALDANYAPALEMKGSIAAASNDSKTALDLFAKAAMADPSNAEYVYLQANTQARHGMLPKALANLERALEIDPGHVAANNDLAWILASDGSDLDKALELAQRAVKLGRNADTLDTLGYVHLKQGNADEAVGVLGKALEARPNSPSIEYHLGAALAAKGDKDEARAILTKALEATAFPEADAARAELAKLQDS